MSRERLVRGPKPTNPDSPAVQSRNDHYETDIPEDFPIADDEETQTSTTVTVPEEAMHQFVAAIDDLYEDNAHGETRFVVRIEGA